MIDVEDAHRERDEVGIHQREEKDAITVRKHLTAWYRQRAEARFTQEMTKTLKRLRLYALPDPETSPPEGAEALGKLHRER